MREFLFKTLFPSIYKKMCRDDVRLKEAIWALGAWQSYVNELETSAPDLAYRRHCYDLAVTATRHVLNSSYTGVGTHG